MRIGYARVSTLDQSVALQRDALTAAGCARILEDRLSGCTRQRPGLDAALGCLSSGDTLVVWRLDRLGRSLTDLIDLVSRVQAAGCGFQSLTESIDTTSAGGQLVFHVFGAIAEFERKLIGERTRAGLAAAKARGVRLGGRPKLTIEQISEAHARIAKGDNVVAIATRYGVGRSTLYRALRTVRPDGPL